jgi:hypothetical protein
MSSHESRLRDVVFVVLCVLGLAACGGGGGGSSAPAGPVKSTLSFPAASAVNTRTANGHTTTLTAKGTSATEITDGLCSGTITQTVGPVTGGATFENGPALSTVEVTTISFSNCTPAFVSSTATAYFDSNYLPLGVNVQGGNYGVYLVPPNIPNSIMVDDAGIIGTETLYTDSTKNVPAGRVDLSFVVEPDTANTAILNLIAKEYDASSQLLFTEQDRYRITSTGATTAISFDIQFATTSSTHLVFR